jgi:hypothetical protein
MGGEGQGHAGRRTGQLAIRRGRHAHPTPDEKKELRQIAAHLKGVQ